jgi:hypothetical protein
MDATGETIRAVVFQDGDAWVAQCLEYDICVQACDTDTLLANLDIAIEAEADLSKEMHGKAFAGIGKAPENFFKMWERCSSRIQPVEDSRRVEVELALCA